MSKWTCPDCGGGFEEPTTMTIQHSGKELPACPWCGNTIGYHEEVRAMSDDKDDGGVSRASAALTSIRGTLSYQKTNLLDRLHEQYESDGMLVLFRCKECGFTSMSLGSLHGHIEGHRGYTRFNIQLPFTETSPADFERLMEMTEVVRVKEEETIELEEVDDYV